MLVLTDVRMSCLNVIPSVQKYFFRTETSLYKNFKSEILLEGDRDSVVFAQLVYMKETALFVLYIF